VVLIDTNEVLSWVKARADQGDGASLWLLSESESDTKNQQQHLREAAAIGFAEAKYELALVMDGGDGGAAGTGSDKLHAGELLNQSMNTIPASKAELAECEYFGECDGIAIDIDAAIAHAREAAQAGYTSAILRIGPHLPAGQMDPDEIAAWSLIDASLTQQGCAGPIFSVPTMRDITGRLNANNTTAQSRALAERFWSDYGSQIMASLGCGS
jgi:TPR repeat protein